MTGVQTCALPISVREKSNAVLLSTFLTENATSIAWAKKAIVKSAIAE